MSARALSRHTTRRDFPLELTQPFQILAFDWDGTAVSSRRADAGPLREELEDLLRRGLLVAVLTGTNFPNVDRQFAAAVRGPPKRNLYVLTNRGSEVYGFDDQSRPVLLWHRTATEEEDRLLTEVADTARDRLTAATGLDIRVIYDRLNRRKIDLIPLPDWTDPPKAALGELLEAVEQRLGRAGFQGGLHEAIALVEQIARARGLREARITSDVKHIEVGLTDKSDAIDWIMRELAGRRGISPESILIAGDEFGSPGGIEGSDRKMMTARSRGAVVVSVGPEPAGVPEGVIHLGGGPACFRALLRKQRAAHERLGRRSRPLAIPDKAPFTLLASPTADPSWLLVEDGFQVAREREVESLFATANGYVGTRAALAERCSVSSPATYVAGVFGTPATPGAVPELVRAPDWTGLRITVGGHGLAVESAETLEHRRVLDLFQGMLWREWRYRDPAGRTTRLRCLRLASLADRHVLLQSLELTPENYDGPVRLESQLGPAPADGIVLPRADLRGNGRPSAPDVLVREVQAAGSSTALAIAVGDRLTPEGTLPTAQEGSARYWDLNGKRGKTYRLDRLACVYTSRDAARPAEAATAHLKRVQGSGSVPGVLAAHRRAWAQRWQAADVQVEGDPEAQRALRFALYHLISAANPEDERVSVGARALTGESYKGHVFWDTDIFLLPFYAFTDPATARALLMYRYHTLPAARDKARALGYRGALYPWESADTGREATPAQVIGPGGRVIPVLCGEQEQHISADVAYAAWQYWQASGDAAFFREAGAEILLETARFWASRVRPGPDGRYHLDRVIGPDEYHEAVDDSAYTNGMAQWNLERGVEAAQLLQERWPERARELFDRLRLGPDEPEQWLATARALYTGFDPRTGLLEEFRGYFGLEPIDLAAYEPRTVPMDVLLGRERTGRTQVVKQADVVMLLALLWDRFPPAVRATNFAYYEPRTGHGSSLSPAVHALVAARLGTLPLAERYFRQAARIDLADSMGNATGGVHMAALGGLWQAAVLGFAGLVPGRGGLTFAPNLPACWQRLRFPLRWRGRQLRVTVGRQPRSLEVELQGGASMRAALAGGPHAVLSPGRRYAITAEGTGWGPWREVR